MDEKSPREIHHLSFPLSPPFDHYCPNFRLALASISFPKLCDSARALLMSPLPVTRKGDGKPTLQRWGSNSYVTELKFSAGDHALAEQFKNSAAHQRK
eukprot:scaffold3740_cov51-Skeletonema_menzelii.AAC.1